MEENSLLCYRCKDEITLSEAYENPDMDETFICKPCLILFKNEEMLKKQILDSK